MSADHGSVAKELERANEEFKEFERKDIKYREDVKHLKAKLKKLQDKLAKDTAKMQVCHHESYSFPKMKRKVKLGRHHNSSWVLGVAGIDLAVLEPRCAIDCMLFVSVFLVDMCFHLKTSLLRLTGCHKSS